MRIVLMICVACGLLVVVGANLQRSIDIARISALYGLLEPTSRTRPLDDPVFRERLDDLFETGSRLDQFMMLCTSEIDQRLVVIEPMILSKHDFVSGVWCFSWGRMGAA